MLETCKATQLFNNYFHLIFEWLIQICKITLPYESPEKHFPSLISIYQIKCSLKMESQHQGAIKHWATRMVCMQYMSFYKTTSVAFRQAGHHIPNILRALSDKAIFTGNLEATKYTTWTRTVLSAPKWFFCQFLTSLSSTTSASWRLPASRCL